MQKTEKLNIEKNHAAKTQNKKRGEEIKKELQVLKIKFENIDKDYTIQMLKMHNLPDKSAPSKDEGNRIEKTNGKIPKFNFKVRDHLEIGETLGIIDVKNAAKISGSRMGILKKEGALLEFALLQYMVKKLVKKGFEPQVPPVLVREFAMLGTGFFPAEDFEYYKIEGEDMFLAGTAEVPLISENANEVFKISQLPYRLFGFSSCFRKEAGSYGRDNRGIFRVHQFDKIEMVIIADTKNSWKYFEELTKINEEIFQELKLPYRLVNISSGELGAPNAKKIDCEVWIPSQNCYRELTSCSHDTDFQARRLNIKYKTKDGSVEYVHTLNDTAIAFGRTIVAILENYQQKDGSVLVPKVLQKECGFSKINLARQK
jgi:seryl-tRNA synthetase